MVNRFHRGVGGRATSLKGAGKHYPPPLVTDRMMVGANRRDIKGAPAAPKVSLMTAITDASLATGLQFCLDAGDMFPPVVIKTRNFIRHEPCY